MPNPEASVSKRPNPPLVLPTHRDGPPGCPPRLIYPPRRHLATLNTSKTFASWTVTKSNLKAKEAVEEWAETLTDRMSANENLLLWGPVGTGKDHLAIAALHRATELQLIEEDTNSLYDTIIRVNGRDFCGQCRDLMDSKQTEEEFLAEFDRSPILIFSDPLPPIGGLTPHQSDMFYRLINRRYKKLVTIVTVNVVDDDDADARMGAPTWDRICDGAWKIHCNWKSHRQPARDIR